MLYGKVMGLFRISRLILVPNSCFIRNLEVIPALSRNQGYLIDIVDTGSSPA